MKVSQRGTP